mmetsp:Transcript_154210/g.494436  ORF Transcript_154210/g.494436 Transcript_154210/m.494436 type:complete len:104 (-) Transcript_154210:1335-1646(-)
MGDAFGATAVAGAAAVTEGTPEGPVVGLAPAGLGKVPSAAAPTLPAVADPLPPLALTTFSFSGAGEAAAAVGAAAPHISKAAVDGSVFPLQSSTGSTGTTRST